MKRTGKYFSAITILLQILLCYSLEPESNGTENFFSFGLEAYEYHHPTSSLDTPIANSIISYYWHQSYFWQKFTGVIPQNAVKGGNNCINRTDAYIGSTVFYNVNGMPTLPSIICQDDPYVHAYYSKGPVKIEANNHTFILCTTIQPDWIHVNRDRIPSHCYPILGGRQLMIPLQIARANIKGVYYLGKRRRRYGLIIWYEEKELIMSNYEILAYCNEKTYYP